MTDEDAYLVEPKLNSLAIDEQVFKMNRLDAKRRIEELLDERRVQREVADEYDF